MKFWVCCPFTRFWFPLFFHISIFFRKLCCGHAVTLSEFFMIDEWILAFRKSGLIVMQYPYEFVYNPKLVQKRYITGFPRNDVQYAVLTRCPATHPDGFVLVFASRCRHVDCPSFKDNAIISNVFRSMKMPKEEITRNPLRKSEKNISYVSCIVDLLTSRSGSVFHPHASTMPVSLATVRNGRKSVSIEWDTMCINIAVEHIATLCRSTEGCFKTRSVGNDLHIGDTARGMYESKILRVKLVKSLNARYVKMKCE